MNTADKAAAAADAGGAAPTARPLPPSRATGEANPTWGAQENDSNARTGSGDVDVPDSFWRALRQLNQFRLFAAAVLALAALAMGDSFLPLREPRIFAALCAVYFTLAWINVPAMQKRAPAFAQQLVRHVLLDLICVGLMLNLSGGSVAGPGLLLIVTMAAVGMLRQQRLVLFWAAVGALVVLAQQLWLVGLGEISSQALGRGGVLAASFFGVALLSHVQTTGAFSAALLAREKSAQAASLARLNARMIQELPFAVMAVDGRGDVLQFNSRAEALLGTRFFNRANLRQCSPTLAEHWRQWRDAQDAPRHPFQVGRDGHRILPRFSELEPTRREGAIVVLQDMTEMEAQAQRMKLASLGLLTANLAHEIRNPLSAIRHAAGLLHEEADSAVGERLTRIIENNCARLNALVEDVLELNRRDRVSPQAVSLSEWAADFVQHFSAREQVPPEVVTLAITGAPSVCMDVRHLEQITWNLLRNAWRYCSKAPGSVRLDISALAGRVDIDIRNDGPPLAEETRMRLFEPFYTTHPEGTGLGLYIARELAEANGATLRAIEVPDGVLFRLSSPSLECPENDLAPSGGVSGFASRGQTLAMPPGACPMADEPKEVTA